jgi:hypothetical protein
MTALLQPANVKLNGSLVQEPAGGRRRAQKRGGFLC